MQNPSYTFHANFPPAARVKPSILSRTYSVLPPGTRKIHQAPRAPLTFHEISSISSTEISSTLKTNPTIPTCPLPEISHSCCTLNTHHTDELALDEVLRGQVIPRDDEYSEYRLPSMKSLIVVIGGNALFQFSYYAIVPAAYLYVEHLGGSPTFSGFVIGVPTVALGIASLVVKRFDTSGQYRRPFVTAYILCFIGNILYALAYVFNFLWLLPISRMIVGLSFMSFMFSRKYLTDPRLVGIRRRTTVTSWYVVGQGFGFTAGVWVGGVLYKRGIKNKKSAWLNGYTAPGWMMAGVWLALWMASEWAFEDLQKSPTGTKSRRLEMGELEMNALEHRASNISNETPPSFRSLTLVQKCFFICMCYYNIAYFFVLSGWEANIPVLTAHAFGYSPYNAGNFMAIGGAAIFPFLFLNVRYSYRVQDRVILIAGTLIGFLGLLIFLAIITSTNTIHSWSLFIAWFLVLLGFNIANTCTVSLVSKKLPGNWNEKANMAIQYCNYIGRVTGAIMGGAGMDLGMKKYAIIQIAVIGIGIAMHLFLWIELKVKTG